MSKKVNITSVFEGDEFNLDDYKYDCNSGHPAVYVGTYAKYNDGSLFGMWLDLTSFLDFEEFYEVCLFLHRDEADPELMLQDFENFPEAWYSEYGLNEATFDKIQKFADLDEDKREAFEAYIECKNAENDEYVFEDFEDCYEGEFDSEEDFARYLADETILVGVPENIKDYFDYEKFASELFYCDYTYWNGFVFRD